MSARHTPARVVLAALLGALGLVLALGMALGALAPPAAATDQGRDVAAATSPAPGQDEVVIEYYYGQGCPVCAKTGPALEQLAADHPQVRLDTYEVWSDAANQRLLEQRADRYNFTATGVPVVLIGSKAWVGFREGVTDRQFEQAIQACTAQSCPSPEAVDLPEGQSGLAAADDTCTPTEGEFGCAVDQAEETIDLPLLGTVSLGDKSLFVSTALIAFVDGVNPCSLWVLTILIALSLNTGSRKRTMIVGLTFITVTAAIYALFIGGLFTVFTFVAFAPWIRVLVALVALLFAAISIKDYFWYKEGLSFTIADDKKPGIYRGMRKVLAQGDNLPAVVGATAVLAAGVSLVEFGCTAGFPVLWTNILSAHDVGWGLFLALLLLYMLIYQLDELLIFGTAVVTLRASKLQEKQGRVLKLVGGLLMLALAIAMLIDPELMSSVTSSLVVFGIAIAAAAIILLLHRVVLPRFGIRIGTEQGLGEG